MPMQRRDAVLWAMRDHPIFQRRASAVIGVDPKSLRRDRPPDDPEIRLEMNTIAQTRRRFGDRRIGVLPDRGGTIIDEK